MLIKKIKVLVTKKDTSVILVKEILVGKEGDTYADEYNLY
jgi:hypothetical protein